MPWWKAVLLWLYCHGSRRSRRARLRRLEAGRRAPVVVFAHHRVADTRPNAWTCSNDVFAEQVAWMGEHGDFVSLREAQRRLREGNPRLAFCMTFDDGYAENLDRAFPLLLRERIPFTTFVTTHQVLTGEPFEHDVERGDRFRPVSLDELRDLARAGASIGAHTRTHADLAAIADEARLRDEIVTAGRDLESAVGAPVQDFAFAYGWHDNLSAAAFRIAREAGYLTACSCYGGYNFPGDDPFHLQRFGGPDSTLRLVNMATLDPRKVTTLRFTP
jgi:peptidoglycan/xylan/chitin deacetylase (PgdA/CDA1 family)